ncbi:MAG: hypothetical protein OQK29_06660 [Ignavibacteriaceae bacterium]|nr:hypothetical protein [Ignavibacteriaceae bacterium]
MKRHCEKSKDGQHTFKKIGVKLIQDQQAKEETLYTFNQCVHCGYKMQQVEMFHIGCVDIWVARDYGAVPYEVNNIEWEINGCTGILSEMEAVNSPQAGDQDGE